MLGIVAFYALPSIIPAHDIFTAILIGASSGLSATGMNQIFKQLKKTPVIEPEVKGSKEIPISTADADSIDKKDS